MTTTTAAVALVLVNYASTDLIAANLPRQVAEEASAQVVLVDNFSDEDQRSAASTLCRERGWTLVPSPNDGFGPGVNRGVAAARQLGCRRVILVNPDLRIDAPTLRALDDHLVANPRTMVAPRLVDEHGHRHFDGFLLDLATGHTRRGWPGDETQIGWLTAACLGFRIVDFDELGGFAPDYFMYWEDVDLSWRARQRGMGLVVRDDLVAVHAEGGTQDHRGVAKSSLYYRYNARNRLLFAARNLDPATRTAWRRTSWDQTRRIWLRGGRRQLLHQPMGLVAAVRGMVEGLMLSSGRHDEATRTVLIAHPSADLYGSDKVVLETIDGFVRAGRDTCVVLPQPGPLASQVQARGARVEILPMPVIRKAVRTPTGMAGMVAAAVRGTVPALRLLRRLYPVAVVANTVTIPQWLLFARLTGTRAVCHVHEAEPSSSNLVWKLLYAPLLLASTIVCNSTFTMHAVTSRWARLSDRAVVVANPVPGPTEPSSPLPVHPDPVRLMFLGRLNPRKGPQIAIRATGLLRDRGIDARLSIVGSVFDGYEWFETELRQLVSQLGLDDHIDFLGHRSDIWSVLAAHDIVLTPSIGEESFGNTVVEAVLAGRPVVATTRMAEAAQHLEAVRLVTPDSADELADAVVGLVGDWDQVRDQVDRDRHAAEHRHAPARYHREIVAAVENGARP